MGRHLIQKDFAAEVSGKMYFLQRCFTGVEIFESGEQFTQTMSDAPDSPPANSPSPKGGGAFETTQWSVILAAGIKNPASGAALEKLCRAYLPPIFAFVRREGYSLHEAEDLTQEFFFRLLSAESFADVSPEKGRFRSWLIGALKHFLLNEWRRGMTQRRGSGVVPISLDSLEPGLRQAYEPRDDETPELAYDRRWVETIIARVNGRLRREYELAEQPERWESLKVYLLQGTDAPSYADTAAALAISESAVKSAVFKLRKRFSHFLHHEISQTVSDPSEVEDELRALLQTLRGGGFHPPA